MTPLRLLIIMALFGVAIAIPLCSGDDERPEGDALVVYCGRDEGLVGTLFKAYEQETGQRVQVFYQGTSELAKQVQLEADLSPCDLFFSQDGGHLGALAATDTFAALPPDIVETVRPRFRGEGNAWLATSARARVLVHDPARLPASKLPRRLKDLPRLAPGLRFGWAPANGSFLAHLSALIDVWGEEPTRQWLSALVRREPAPIRFTKNSAQVTAVANDELDVGWVNHYYAHKLREQRPELRAANRSFAEAGDLGNLLIVAGVGITAPEGPRREAALDLLRFLLSKKAQAHFAGKLFEYPTVPGTPLAKDVPPLDSLGLADVDPRAMLNIGRARALLDSLGIR